MFLIGLDPTIGNYIGGRLADWRLGTAVAGILAVMAQASAAINWTSSAITPVEINLFVWAMAGFATVPALQINMMKFGKVASNLASTLNIATFNVGNAVGA
ncbi:hypothetical protein QN362_13270 [Actimicrobium sp. CCC2.4]|uniref:hypothetical protein n=1 Tax=Actimicrobium sp. CCC2.4 TaxID=3048606 RepID=UPI002AC8B181|nr:hypothetical protein [Actimicrobium sp. CCC2.4]MEB0136306.1 hypothetical protein [Actimicrobium sp. CCC2.4]WPX31129.1 hypothetical protein RHM62_12825 [Actimicrobium sp. CCC2.4]